MGLEIRVVGNDSGEKVHTLCFLVVMFSAKRIRKIVIIPDTENWVDMPLPFLKVRSNSVVSETTILFTALVLFSSLLGRQ